MRQEVTFTDCRIFNGQSFEQGKISVDGARITETGTFDGIRGKEIKCGALAVLPALVDNHVHFRTPGREEKEDFTSGSSASAHGGVGTVLEVQNCTPLMSSPDLVRQKRKIIAETSLVKVGIYGSAVPKILPCIQEMAELTSGIKLFMAPSHGDDGLDGEDSVRPFFQAAAENGFLLIVHAEDGGVVSKASKKYGDKGPAFFSKARPPRAELEAVELALKMAKDCGTDLHIFHLTTAGAVDLVSDARKSGVKVTCSTCPHYLFFTEEDLRSKGGLLKVNPSIKSAHDQARLLEALRNNEIEIVSTDHAPHKPEEKSREFEKVPAGISSADLLLPLMSTLVARGDLTFADVARLCIENPVKIHDLVNGSSIKTGDPADLVFFDPEREWEVKREDFLSKANLSPYVGMKLTGRVAATLVDGKAVYIDQDGPLFGRLPA